MLRLLQMTGLAMVPLLVLMMFGEPPLQLARLRLPMHLLRAAALGRKRRIILSLLTNIWPSKRRVSLFPSLKLSAKPMMVRMTSSRTPSRLSRARMMLTLLARLVLNIGS